MISMPYPTASTPGGGLLRPFQPCFGDAESAAKNDQLDALSLFGSLRGRGDYGTLLLQGLIILHIISSAVMIFR